MTDLDGESVALTSPEGTATKDTIAPGRATPIRVVGSDGQWDVGLAGNVVPEAFSIEPAPGAPPWLYVIEYLPADAPTHYRVRLLDMGTGELSWPVNLRRKTQSIDTQMAGVSRDQVVATERGLLFTLYRGHHGAEGTEYAFVHTLAMGGGVWCLEVPAELDLANVAGAVAVSADERWLYAASANGTIAEYDVDAVLDPLRVPGAARTVAIPPRGSAPPVLAVSAHHVVQAQGSSVIWLDPDSLDVVAKAGASGDIDAMVAVADSSVVVSTGDRLELLSAGGVVASMTLPPGVGRVTKLVPG